MCGHMEVKTAGLGGDEKMRFGYDTNACGDIADGVSFNIGHGCWVISFDDLERMYIKADKYRQEQDAIR